VPSRGLGRGDADADDLGLRGCGSARRCHGLLWGGAPVGTARLQAERIRLAHPRWAGWLSEPVGRGGPAADHDC
jgi:hypothetical protein